MTLLPQSVDYTDKDFESLRLRLRRLIATAFPGWTDDQVANFGNILVELMAHVGDVLLFYQDNQAGESRITTAQLRRSMLALVKLIAFVPAGAVAARADVTFTLSAVAAGDVIIPAETLVRTENVPIPTEFRLLSPLQILAGGLDATGTCENSELREDAFASNELKDQFFELTATPYLDDSAVVLAGDGTYTQVDNFLDSTATDRHFTVSVDDQDRALLRFGDGVNGAIPVGTITVTYRVGGGAAGTVEANTVVVLEGTFTDTLGNPVTLTVNNAAASTAGVDRQGVEEIRREAPDSVRVTNRSVTREDFEINARLVAGVGRALMLTSNEDPGIGENAGTLYILPTGGGTATAQLLSDVETFIQDERPPTLTFALTVAAAPLLSVNVSTTVHLAAGVVDTVARDAVIAALTAYFAPDIDPDRVNQGLPQVDFGFRLSASLQVPDSSVPWSDVFDAVRDVSEVRKIDDGDEGLLLNGTRADLSVLPNQFPQLGTVTVINAATGTPI